MARPPKHPVDVKLNIVGPSRRDRSSIGNRKEQFLSAGRHTGEPHRVASEYLGHDFRDFCAQWRFQPAGDGTHAELQLRIDSTRFPAP